MDHHSPTLQTMPLDLAVPNWDTALVVSETGLPLPLGNGLTLWLARWVLPVASPAIDGGYVLARDGDIQSIGAFSDLPEDWRSHLQNRYEQAYRQGLLISPGLINAHTHLEQSVGTIALMPDSSTPDMAAWLVEAKPKLDRLNSDSEYQSRVIEQGINELLASGTTCINDISRLGATLEPLNQANLRGTVSLEFFHPNTETLNEAFLTPVLERYVSLSSDYAKHPFLRVGLSPHSPYNVSPIAWRWMLDKVAGLHQEPPIIHTHLSESQAECDYLAGKPSGIDSVHQAYVGKTFPVATPMPTPVQYLSSHGLLTKKLIAAHGVYLCQQDAVELKQHQIGIAHCPRSNVYLQGRTIDWQLCQNNNIPVGLGTDGHLSTPGLDVRAEARIARIYHYLNAADTIRLMTVSAAQVLGLEDTIGRLQKGFAADLALWKPADHEMGLSPEEQLLSPQTQCVGTWVSSKACGLP